MDHKGLPSRPNLQQYRKQAKDLVKRHKAGDPETMRRIAEHHPRLGKVSDSQAQSTTFALADAQLVIAREHGFGSWVTFTKHIESLQPQGEPGRHRHSLQSVVPSDDEIRRILSPRIAKYQQSVGMVVGVVEPAGRRIVSCGVLDKGDERALGGDTVFEIGSITEAVTTLLLMDMVERGEVALSDPVGPYLPKHVTIPQRNGRRITLGDLATHRSGLPRLPSNFEVTDRSNPFADYTVERLYDFLATYELPRDVDAKMEHSILGFGLLGHALERRAGIGYESLLRTRILDPLGMSSTGIALTPEVKARLAPGHNGELERVTNWNLPAFASAGALWSTANDLLTFLGATLGQAKSPLSAAASALLRVSRELGREGPLGWWSVTLDGVFARDGRSVYLTSGATRGYSAFAGFEPKAQAGVVLLANVLSVSWGRISELYDFGNVGLHLLDPRWPLH